MKLRLIASLAALLAVSSAANATEWTYVTVDSIGSEIYIDPSSVRNASSPIETYLTAWFNVDQSKNEAKRAKNIKQLIAIKCDEYKLGLMQSISYDAAKQIIDSEVFEYPNWRSAVPDSVGYDMLQAACGVQ